jgi:hypothetical protein
MRERIEGRRERERRRTRRRIRRRSEGGGGGLGEDKRGRRERKRKEKQRSGSGARHQPNLEFRITTSNYLPTTNGKWKLRLILPNNIFFIQYDVQLPGTVYSFYPHPNLQKQIQFLFLAEF